MSGTNTSAGALYTGKTLQLTRLEGGIVELTLNATQDSVNKFNAETLGELRAAVDQFKAAKDLKGVLITSAKDVFVVGADITEFLSHFNKTEAELTEWLLKTDSIFNDLEDLPCPSVVAINGFSLGGGMEFCLSATYRLMAATTKIGLPEVKLGIYPGWGGTVRLPRVAGADVAIEWIASGEQYGAEAAFKAGVVDGVTAPEKLREAALVTLKEAMEGKLDWRARQAEKKAPLKLNATESAMVFQGSKAFVAGKAGPNYPAPVAAIESIEKGARLTRDEALKHEAAGFARVAKSPTAVSLVTVFLNDQYVKKVSKKYAGEAVKVELAGVLGAGIMGGGIAYQAAVRKTPILMKDIATKALDLGMGEAAKLLDKQVSKGALTTGKMAETLGRIRPTLTYGDFKDADFVVEAVVENEKIKLSVLAEVEAASKPGAVIASNTSTISIDCLAQGMKHPENFCGMHFFNPVHRMPLVEIIRGKKTSDATIARTVQFAQGLGKTPIVVNDCPGFLVNRVLFPYFSGFQTLLADGVDFQRIDRVMEKFGWPMGPAYLLDVVGIDTAVHADRVMAAGFPDRMAHEGKTAIEVMVEAKRFGQKNGVGFYKYTPDKKGPPKKEVDPSVMELLKSIARRDLNATITDEQIIDRMMLPMLVESARCLEEGIVGSPMETDIALLFGLGFPPFRGGIFRHADTVGLKTIVEKADAHREFGKLYAPTDRMREMAKSGKGFYPSL